MIKKCRYVSETASALLPSLSCLTTLSYYTMLYDMAPMVEGYLHFLAIRERSFSLGRDLGTDLKGC